MKPLFFMALMLFSSFGFSIDSKIVTGLVERHIEKDTAQFANQKNWKKYRFSRDFRIPSSLKKLDDCQIPIAVELLNEPTINRIRYKLSCYQSTKNQKWSVTFNINISYYVPVASLPLPLPRGHALESDDLIFSEQKMRRNKHYYFSIDSLVGKKIKRNLQKNSVLQKKDIEKEEAVSRGQEVIIVLEHEALTLTLTGIALKSGELGDVIKVRNKHSGNIITTTVIGKNKVSVRIN